MLAGAAIALSMTVAASTPALADRDWSAAFYASQLNLRGLWDTFPIRLVNAYSLGIGINKTVLRDPFAPMASILPPLADARVEWQIKLLQHVGMERHTEFATALLVRSRNVSLPGGTSVNVAIGNGVSYAFSLPRLENGYNGRTTQLLNYMVVELEFEHQQMPNVQFVLNLHHRCSAWGLFGPAGAGSNYFGAALRFSR